MKKLILAVFIFCSAFASAQIYIPQVLGLPAALNSKVDKVTGKSLVADTLSAKIQPHVTNLSNPHAVTKAQVGLGNVDNTSDVNKPISSATQTALNGKQASGTYSTDIHSNITALNDVLGSNHGDETLTSIKTKLGAATSVSDGYLKYQDLNTLNGKQNALTIGNLTSTTNGFSITNGAGAVIGTGTAINISTATSGSGGILTSTDWNVFNNKEPAFSKNTAFNKNFGTTTGTVLEGRTFGSAASSAVGDFQPIENQRLSTSNSPTFSSVIAGSLVSNIHSFKVGGQSASNLRWSLEIAGAETGSNDGSDYGLYNFSDTGGYIGQVLSFKRSTGASMFSGNTKFNSTTASTSPTTGALVVGGGIGADHVRANNFYGSGSNLTGVQLPITLTTTGTSGVATLTGTTLNVPNYGGGSAIGGIYTSTDSNLVNVTGVSISSATYTLVGSICTVSLRCQFTFTGSTDCEVNLSLPFTNGASAIKVFGGLALGNGQIYTGQSSVQGYASIGFKKPASVSTAWFDAIIIYQVQ